MSLSALIIWEVRTTGSSGNGGGFKAGASGTDRSQQDIAFVVIDGVTITATVHTTTTQITISGYTVSANDVGNVLQITGGTATAGYYEITAVDLVNNRWTLDRSVGTSTQTVIGNMGGAVVDIGNILSSVVTSNTIYVKAGTYNRGSVLSVNVGISIIGYESTRGDATNTRAILKATSGSSYSLMELNSVNGVIQNLVFDGNSRTSILGLAGIFNVAEGWFVRRCTFKNCTNYGAYTGNLGNYFIDCYATNCGNAGISIDAKGLAFGCQCHANTAYGWEIRSNTTLIHCLGTANSNDGFNVLNPGTEVKFTNCTAHSNSGGGFVAGVGCSYLYYTNCISYNNSGWGFQAGNGSLFYFYKFAAGANGSGRISPAFMIDLDGLVLGTDPCNSDFTLTTSSACKDVGFPGNINGTSGISHVDIGALQSQGTGSTTVAIVTKRRVM